MTAAVFVEMVKPASLITIKNVDTIKELKKIKTHELCKGKCATNGSGKYNCQKCKNINKMMCRQYHNQSPLEELVGRLFYEYLFGYISLEDLITGSWTHVASRDDGHNLRIQILKSRVGMQLRKCGWLMP